MSDDTKYVPAPTEAEIDEARRLQEAKVAAIRHEAAIQMKIREWHHLISPWLFNNREIVKRNYAIMLRNQGEAGVASAQGQT